MIGEIKQIAGSVIPAGWLACDGAILHSASYADLFAAIGNTYGGTSPSFALPDARGRSLVHPNASQSLGDKGGGSTTLTLSQLPPHSHPLPAFSDDGETDEPSGAVMAKAGGGESIYAPDADDEMQPTGNTGLGSPVPTVSPFLVVNTIIKVEN